MSASAGRIIINESLFFTVKVFGSFLLEGHDLHQTYLRTMRKVTVSVLVKEVEAYKLCGGVNASEMTGKLYHYGHFFESRLGGG